MKVSSRVLVRDIMPQSFFSYKVKNELTCTDEELIKWGWPEDVWFHVDKLSSAHVYLRLRKVGIHDCNKN
jgi:hypothetical protein